MLLHPDFNEMPPKMFMLQILDNIGKAYCFLWDHKNSENRISFDWKDLSKYFNKNTFRTCIRKLNNIGLLSYNESEKGVTIELVGWNEIDDE